MDCLPRREANASIGVTVIFAMQYIPKSTTGVNSSRVFTLTRYAFCLSDMCNRKQIKDLKGVCTTSLVQLKESYSFYMYCQIRPAF